MTKFFMLMVLFTPLFVVGQEASTTNYIDSIISAIDNDVTLIKKQFDTVTYVKADGTNNWDSSYFQKEFFYRNGHLIKIIAWNKYGNRRINMLAYYQNDKTIQFQKGESFKGHPDYGKLNFVIYYYQDKDIGVTWLTPKPDNVMGIATDIFLNWSYQLQREAR